MSEFKGTSGPWGVEASGYGSIITKEGESMAAVWPQALSGTPFPHEANARLISAAPDLLEACIRAFEQTDSVTRSADWGLLRAAITKALGHEV